MQAPLRLCPRPIWSWEKCPICQSLHMSGQLANYLPTPNLPSMAVILKGGNLSFTNAQQNLHHCSTDLRNSLAAKYPTGNKLKSGPYVGFSFNPLFFGPADMPKEDSTSKGATKHVFSLKGAPQDQVGHLL
jgi:hypothetical protein